MKKNLVYTIIREDILQYPVWLMLSFAANLIGAIFDGGSFGIIVLALQVLQSGSLPNLSSLPLSNFPSLLALINNLTAPQLFGGLILLAVSSQILRSLLVYSGQLATYYLATNVQINVQHRVYKKILSLSFPCVSRYKVGDLIEYATSPSVAVGTVMGAANQFLVAVLTILASFVVMVILSPQLTFIALIIFGPLMFLQKFLIKKIEASSKILTPRIVELSKKTVESLSALRQIHTFARQEMTLGSISEVLRSMAQGMRHLQFWHYSSTPMNEIITIAAVGLFLIIGSRALGNGSFTALPVLLTFITVVYRMANRLQVAITSIGTTAYNLGPLLRLQEILDPQDKEFIKKDGKEFQGFENKIEFNDVSLQYLKDRKHALHHISLTIPKGTTIAFVGASGSGKSSLVDLLVRLYEPTSGKIYVDGINLQEYSLTSWRKILGVVSQDIFIFNESIADNIRFGLKGTTDEEIIEAAQAAQIHDLIDELPEGYQTIVGERGYRLSGGQRQRLSLARALLRKPEILILDEATSSLDSHSEQLIQKALNNLKKRCTLIVVAHRLSTISNADNIFVLEKGRLIEQGNHFDLLKKGKKYTHYWNLQLGLDRRPQQVTPEEINKISEIVE